VNNLNARAINGFSDKTIPNLSISYIAGLLLLVGCINGLIAEIGRSLQEQGLNSAAGLFGIGFYFPAIICIALSKMQSESSSASTPFQKNIVMLASCLFCMLILVPSSLVSWLAVGLYAASISFLCRGEARTGAILFAALALCALWTNFGFKLFVTPLTNLDTILIQWILEFLGFTVQRNENILTQASGFSVIILADCSTWKGLPLEILSFIAVCIFGGASLRSKRVWTATIVMIPLMIILNLARLSLISLSPELHETVHGDLGRSIFDFVRVSAIFAFALFIVQ
jgi:exosortase/archaeosortase